MVGIHGFPRDPHRACNLYRAAAWGCTEEEEPDQIGIPNGIPEAMIASASIARGYLTGALMGFDNPQDVSFEDMLKEGLKTETGLSALYQILDWTTKALRLHGWVTSLTLMLASAAQTVNFVNDPRLVRSDVGKDMQSMCASLVRAQEYREKELTFEKMQQKGKFPRGDPPNSVIELFRPKALEIVQNLPMIDDTMHIEFKQVPRSPFPMVAISFIPSKRKVQKIVRLPDSLQMIPFSKEAFQFVWLRIAFDIHLGRLGTDERVRPMKFSVPDTHGNNAFASYLEDMLKDSDTKVQRVSHTDTIKTGKRSTSLGQLVSETLSLYLDIPGVLVDSDSAHDIVARAQEDFVDRIIEQQMSDIESEDDAFYSEEAGQMKARGNQYFQAQDFNAAVRCYSIALGQMRRVVEHDQVTHKLLGTLLSNRAACFLGLLVEGQHSLEFRKVLARNAINDCTSAIENSWASSSLPYTIMEKLRFRRDKATASYDSLNAEFDSVADILFPASYVNEERINTGSTAAANRSNSEHRQARSPRSSNSEHCEKNISDAGDALLEYGEVLFKNDLAKNAEDGCPICMREFSGELAKTYAVVLPCGEHAICANCACSLKIEADKAKQCPQCPLCRYSFDPEFVEGLSHLIIDKDQELAHLIMKLPNNMGYDEKIAIAERLLWTHRFELPAVIDAIEALLDGETSSLFFRSDGDLTSEQKSHIYCQSRGPVCKLEIKLNLLLQEQRGTVDSKALEKICVDMRRTRKELATARDKAREDIYSRMNSVGTMGAQQDGHNSSFIQVDYHGLHVNEMRRKFKEHVLPILPVVGKVMIITGRGSHSVGKESKLKKALFKLIGQNEKDIYWQRVEKNPGALYVLWRRNQ
mmetsp:Transcript_5372/g.12205  ORF Transcript_5372/g.12205 Transcript_5372/m.12205 type:complete len:867 (-) Transcript_5372:35-2635(-)